MSNKQFVYVVSADQAWVAAHKETLAQRFDLNIFTSVADCKAVIFDRQPNLLMLDMATPDALAFHRELRDDFQTSDVFQLLLCEDADLAQEGVIADDFVLRPFSSAVFWKKIDLMEKAFAAQAQTKEQMSYAQNVALTAMSSMGELGVVMQFLSQSFACKNMQGVADLALNALRQYDLEGVIHFVWQGDSLTVTTHGGEPLEEQLHLIAQRRTLGRILEINEKLVVNYDHVSILIAQMPDDAQRCGRIRDNIATLAEGIESRAQALLLEHDNLLKQQGIRYAVFEIRDSVKNLGTRQLENIETCCKLVNERIDMFEDAFLHMDVPLEIENRLIGELVDLRHKVTELIERPSDVHDKLQVVIAALETLAGEVGATAA